MMSSSAALFKPEAVKTAEKQLNRLQSTGFISAWPAMPPSACVIEPARLMQFSSRLSKSAAVRVVMGFFFEKDYI